MSPLIIFIAAGAFVLLILIIGIVVSINSNRSSADERLEQIISDTSYDDTYTTQDNTELDDASSPLVNWLDRRVEGSSWAERTAKQLAQADLKMKPGEYMALIFIAIFFASIFFWFIGGRSFIGLAIGAFVGFIAPGIFLRSQQNKRLNNFNSQLPDMLSLMVNGLRAGYSTMQAMESISKEMPSPISEEFRRVVQEMQLGITMEDALSNLLRRIPSDDLDLLITAINVQREVGGNLAEMLDTISYTIRERIRVKGEIKTLTTQVMYSGNFLAVMPALIMGVLFLINREYMMQFFLPENNMAGRGFPCGYCVLAVVAVLIIIGYFVMKKLSEVEI